MGIMLGNLSVRDIEKRLFIELKEEDKEALETGRQQSANGPWPPGSWHCFDIPFLIQCDGMETAKKVADILNKYPLKGAVQIGW